MITSLKQSYPRLAKDLLAPVLELCHVAHEVFAGDFEQFYIPAVIAARTAEDPRMTVTSVQELEAGSGPDLPSLGTNVRSLSASTGIPLETVRRKVKALRARGWVCAHGRNLAYTSTAAQALTPVRNAVMALALSNYRTLSKLHPPPD